MSGIFIKDFRHLVMYIKRKSNNKIFWDFPLAWLEFEKGKSFCDPCRRRMDLHPFHKFQLPSEFVYSLEGNDREARETLALSRNFESFRNRLKYSTNLATNINDLKNDFEEIRVNRKFAISAEKNIFQDSWIKSPESRSP